MIESDQAAKCSQEVRRLEERTVETYEFDGRKYREASRHQKEWGRALISSVSLKGSEKILDLGCGDGVLTAQLASLVPAGDVLGIDASEGMLAAARSIHLPNLKFLRLDISQMDFQDEFDLIFSNAALHWVKDHDRLLCQARRALRKGGMIAWNFAAGGTCTFFIAVIRELMRDAAWRSCFADYPWPWYMPDGDDYRKAVREAGFSCCSVEVENRDRFFADAQEMTAWIDQPSIVPFLSRIPPEKKEAFRSAVVDEMIKRTRKPDGTCFETFRRIRVTAAK